MKIKYANIYRAIIVVILSFTNMFCFGQSMPKILTVDKFQKGIYKDFEEFLNDSPSISFDFELNATTKSKQFWLGGGGFDLVIKDTGTGISKKIKKSFWGVSTGDSIFIAVKNFQENGKGFEKILSLGRYCVVRATPAQAQVGPLFGAIGVAITKIGMAIDRAEKDVYILNVNNGKFFFLHRLLMLKILSDDAELLESYKIEKKPDDLDTMVLLIKEYNKRHGDQVKLR